MTTSPLKTATRVLSIATVVVAAFAVWAITTQDLSRRPISTSIGNSAHDPVELTKPPATRIAKPTSPTRPEFATHTKSISSRDQDSPSDLHPAPRRSFPQVSPDVGRAPNADDNWPLLDDTIEQNHAEPPTIAVKRSESRPRSSQAELTAGNDQSLPQPDTGIFKQVDSRLSTLQQQINQLAQAQVERQAEDIQQATDLLKQLQQQKDATKLEKLLEDIQKARKTETEPSVKPVAPAEPPKKLRQEEDDPAQESSIESQPGTDRSSDPQKRSVIRAEPVAGQPERFDFHFQDADISEALAMLGQLSGMNILVGRGVNGKVPAANLQEVTAEQALDAVTRTLGFVYEREGNFIFVQSQSDALQRKQAARKTVTKIIRPRYISTKELQTLITPLLTKVVGLVAVTNPAESGLEVSRTKAGGDSMSQTDALLVVDYPEVIAQIETVVLNLDVPPAQVVIEAMILNVKLTESMKLGVNFALLNNKHKQLLTTGNGSKINSSVGFPNDTSLIPAAGDFIANTAGLKYGFLSGNISGFVEALEELTDTSVVASPSVRVLNKQRAELIIGERLGYRTTTFNGTQTVENINFLEVGTKLILRPYVAEDGLVRMEIHPERSDGKVVAATGLPESRTTEVTSNVMVRDGTTIVIGGLIEEQINQGQSRIPGLAGVPVVGNLFKNKTNDTTRTELIVLITPRVVHDFDAESEGAVAQAENERRHEEFRNNMSQVNRSSLARIEYERAARYFEEGELSKAKWHIEQSLRHDRNDTDSLHLKDQITASINDKNWFKKLRRKPAENYHRVSSAPMSAPNGEAVFEFETETQPSSVNPPPLPPAPSAARSTIRR